MLLSVLSHHLLLIHNLFIGYFVSLFLVLLFISYLQTLSIKAIQWWMRFDKITNCHCSFISNLVSCSSILMKCLLCFSHTFNEMESCSPQMKNLWMFVFCLSASLNALTPSTPKLQPMNCDVNLCSLCSLTCLVFFLTLQSKFNQLSVHF